jgi:phosphoenolpyruvate-protein kinase (PTS system EI component)
MQTFVSLVGEPFGHVESHFDGVGLIRGEYFQRRVLRSICHDDVRSSIEAYLDEVCHIAGDREVWYRLSDLWSDEGNVLDGAAWVPPETNPLVGMRGVRRLTGLREELDAECAMLASLGKRWSNLGVIVPFVVDEQDFSEVADVLRSHGFAGVVGSMIETPAAAVCASAIIDRGAGRLLFGLNDLSCLVLASDRSADDTAKMHPALWSLIESALRAAHHAHVRCGLAGSLTERVVARARRAGLDYVTLHYSQARELLGEPEPAWPLEDLDREIKRITRAAKADSMRGASAT